MGIRVEAAEGVVARVQPGAHAAPEGGVPGVDGLHGAGAHPQVRPLGPDDGLGTAAQLVPADDHVVAGGVQHPVVALTRVVVVAGHLDEALVEAEVVSDGVLPALLVALVVREVLHDEFVDLAESHALLGAAADGHHDEGVVAVGRFLRPLVLLLPVLPVLVLVLCGLRGGVRRRFLAIDVVFQSIIDTVF